MKFIPYLDEFGKTHFFDATRVMFTMTQPIGIPDENGHYVRFGCKVAMNENMGFIIADEEPEVVLDRIKEANGLS